MQKETDAAQKQKNRFTCSGLSVFARDEEKAKRILGSLEKIPVGKYSLKKLAEYQTEIYFSDTLGEKAIGCYCDDSNRIFLSTAFSEACLKTTLVHEATHAVQHRNGATEMKNENLNARSRLLLDRCLEADAQCAALEAANQFAVRGDKAPLEAFRLDAPEMVEAFNRDKSYSDAYKAWFDNRYIVEAYERAYIGEKVISSMKSRNASDEEFEVASVSRLERVCGLYCDDFKDFVRNDKKALTLHPLTKAFLELKNAANVAKGAETDVSVKSLPALKNKNSPDSARMFSEMKNLLNARQYGDTGNHLMYLSLQRVLDTLEKDSLKNESAPSAYDSKRERIFMYMATSLERSAPKSILKSCSEMSKDDYRILQLHAQKMRAPARELTETELNTHRRNLNRIAGEIKIPHAVLQQSTLYGSGR